MNETTNGEWNITNETLTKNVEKPESVITKRKIVGIYGLRNKITGKWYVGQSVNIHRRWRDSYKNLRCAAQHKIYNAILKYGYDNFDSIVLEECEVDQLNDRETFWIRFYDSVNIGYNLNEGGRGGICPSQETRNKMSRANIGNKKHLGKTHSEESRKKMSEALTGRHLSEEHKKSISNGNKGKTRSSETIEKIRSFHIGRKRSEKTRERLRNAWKLRRLKMQ